MSQKKRNKTPHRASSVLYSIYRFTHLLTARFANRVTPLGVMVLCAFPPLFMVALTYYRLATFYLFLLLAVVVMVAVVTSLARRASCVVRRQLPAQALAGEELMYHCLLTNTGKRTLHSA